MTTYLAQHPACLSSDELVQITRKCRAPAQAKVLNALGIVHKRRPDGSILVHRAHYDQLLGAVATCYTPPVKALQPKWE